MRWKVNLEKGPLFTSIFQSRKAQPGFTLVEIVVVISLLVILATLAWPPLLRARVQSNESAVKGNLRTISSAAEGFRTTQNPPAYPADLNTMITSNPPYLDSSWANNQRQGYNYTYAVAGDQSTYSVTASPQIMNISGINSYCVDQTGIIRSYPPGQGGAIGGATGCSANGVPI